MSRYFSRMIILRFSRIFLAAAIVVAMGSCASPERRDAPADAAATTPEADAASSANTITFKADGAEVRTTGHNIARTRMAGKVILNITSSMHTDERTINVNLAGTAPGKYPLVEAGSGLQSSGGLYFPRYSAPGDAYTFTSGTFDITKVDTIANILEGTFSGSARNPEGKTVSITEGRITAGTLVPGIVDLEAMMK